MANGSDQNPVLSKILANPLLVESRPRIGKSVKSRQMGKNSWPLESKSLTMPAYYNYGKLVSCSEQCPHRYMRSICARCCWPPFIASNLFCHCIYLTYNQSRYLLVIPTNSLIKRNKTFALRTHLIDVHFWHQLEAIYNANLMICHRFEYWVTIGCIVVESEWIAVLNKLIERLSKIIFASLFAWTQAK